ncbi:klaroid protein-like [Sitodiplosis mosellana]|uniref:klaroid protein-like n=1 Tax=Sitodiplosis mosellana TaxID=263140 RepID=UPI0024452B8B|nr:klaroid protein-like [Sitodiplosis mosellana]XP_055309743.1 klaroid protein-like [Sitodiplosis mosellana]XP_055309744.1 klaroid protein-like [Sitodiplosis mosellana]
MEEENNKRETRRSRSKTPLTLRSSVDRDVEVDGEKKKVKKNPTVETITEESPAPVVTQRSTRTKRNAAKATNDESQTVVNKETVALIANSVAVVPQAISASEQTVTKTTTVITSKSVKSLTGEQLLNEKQQHQTQTMTKSSAATTRSREANQNESNLLLEQNAKLKTSTPRANKDKDASNNSNNSSFNNSSSITNGTNLEDHVAFKEYKEAGEYWNKFPKTDYTYSKLSQHRREIKPGVIAMPNMSRRSLEHHQTRVNDMVRRDPAQESFFRSRYEALTTLRKRRAADSYYDSQDETDISFGLNGGRSYTESRSFFSRLITVITTFFSSTYYHVTSIFRREQPPSIYYARFAEPKKGIIRRSWYSITNAFLAVFRYIYLGISTVLYLDSRALQSTSQGKKKGFLIGLLVLLPLLLLGGKLNTYSNLFVHHLTTPFLRPFNFLSIFFS